MHALLRYAAIEMGEWSDRPRPDARTPGATDLEDIALDPAVVKALRSTMNTAASTGPAVGASEPPGPPTPERDGRVPALPDARRAR
jgi:hypothetical protein